MKGLQFNDVLETQVRCN